MADGNESGGTTVIALVVGALLVLVIGLYASGTFSTRDTTNVTVETPPPGDVTVPTAPAAETPPATDATGPSDPEPSTTPSDAPPTTPDTPPVDQPTPPTTEPQTTEPAPSTP